MKTFEEIFSAINSLAPESVTDRKSALLAIRFIDALKGVAGRLENQTKDYARAAGAIKTDDPCVLYAWRPTITYKWPKVQEALHLCKQMGIEPESVLKVDSARAQKTALVQFAETGERKTFGRVELEKTVVADDGTSL